MKKSDSKRRRLFPLICLMLTISLAGCGSRRPEAPQIRTVAEMREEKEAETETAAEKETKETDKVSPGSGKNGDLYLEKREMEDLNDPEKKCEIYLPKGTEINEGYGFYHQHGIYLSAFVNRVEGEEPFEDYFTLIQEYLSGPDMDYADLTFSGVMENGDDRYFIYTGRYVQYDGTPCEIRMLEYMSVQPSNNYVNWSFELIAEEVDEETDLIIGALEECYGIDLELFKRGSSLPEKEALETYTFKENGTNPETLDGYQYFGKAVMADYNGLGVCPVIMPKGNYTNMENSHACSFLHGVWMTADVEEFYMGNLMTELKSNMDTKYGFRSSDSEKIRNVWKSSLLQIPGFENAFYALLTYEKKEYNGEYTKRVEGLCYMQYDQKHYIALEIFLSEERYDDDTRAVIQELETAYGIELLKYFREDVEETASANREQLITMAQLAGDGSQIVEETLPDTVLWFNATYAPLTYSNGWNWKLVGGIYPTEENIEINKYLLEQSWNIDDRESALDTAEQLKEKGHRNTCQECMDELEELGLLDLEEKEFLKEIKKLEDSKKAGRFQIVYQMYHAGLKPDDMAAWDLCRVNQLYASFYICGYLTYEEAMDASLENSLVLQSMYSSWDDMMEGYLLGYRFWLGDIDADEDSLTQERRRMYEMMLQMEDHPYLLDWNLELKKSW